MNFRKLQDDVQVYEVLTEEDISAEEGTQIADILAEELKVKNWDFEASTEY